MKYKRGPAIAMALARKYCHVSVSAPCMADKDVKRADWCAACKQMWVWCTDQRKPSNRI